MSGKKTGSYKGKGAIDIIEESIQILKASPYAIVPYYIGSAPFVLGLLYFWADMSHSAYAYSHKASSSLGLCVLFIWMKSWQSVYAGRLLDRRSGRSPDKPTFIGIIRMSASQIIIQPWSFLVLPISLLLAVPFGWAYAFFNNATVFGLAKDNHIKSILRNSRTQASVFPYQNHILIWLLSPLLLITAAFFIFVIIPFIKAIVPEAAPVYLLYVFILVFIPFSPLCMIIAVNIGISILTLPGIIKVLTGIESSFSMSPHHAINTTFFAVVCGITYLCIDPLMKAAYVLRCFYGRSLHTGDDIRFEIRGLKHKAMVVACICGFILLNTAATLYAENHNDSLMKNPVMEKGGLYKPSVHAEEFDQAIDSTLSKPEYTWRMPREDIDVLEEKARPLFIQAIIDTLKDWFETIKGWFKTVRGWFSSFFKWLHRLLSRFMPKQPGRPDLSNPHLGVFIKGLIIVLMATVALLAGFILWRTWKERKKGAHEIIAERMPEVPNLDREDIDATELPEHDWLRIAGELLEKGQYRLCLRALYLSCLSHLAEKGLITVATYKSDREYIHELKRRAHGSPDMIGVFSENTFIFENSWYGMHDVTMQTIEIFKANQERMRSYAKD